MGVPGVVSKARKLYAKPVRFQGFGLEPGRWSLFAWLHTCSYQTLQYVVLFVCCLFNKNLVSKLDIWSERKKNIISKTTLQRIYFPKDESVVPTDSSQNGSRRQTVHNSGWSGQSIRVITRVGPGFLFPHLISSSDVTESYTSWLLVVWSPPWQDLLVHNASHNAETPS